MTHHTDAQRAAFEAWARGYGTWEVKRDDDVALGTTGYTDITLTVAWHAVQAARRAPAAPASEPELEAALNAMDKEVARMQPDRSVHWIGFTRDDRLRVVAAALAAAPQPPDGLKRENPATKPEAAPVPLRKPTVDQVSAEIGYHASAWDCVDPRELIDAILMLAAAPQPPEAAPVELPEYGIDTANHAGIRVRGYTEQQVRELLAAQASVSNGTLASQPPFQTEAGAARQLEEIAVLVRVLVRALRKADPANPRAARALDYLKRHGLQGNPLRAPGD